MKVSVLVKTFEHEHCIGRALDSVLAQRADFAWELVVGEDCSTDGTRGELERVRAAHPDRVRLLLHERNLGPVPNLLDTLAACRGEYVALLDGDDYWTATDKLQRQVDLLDADPQLSACAHDVELVDAAGHPQGRIYGSPRLPPLLTLDRILRGPPVLTCGLMFRRRLTDSLPDGFADLPLSDWPLLVHLAAQGPIRYERAVRAAYRIHDQGLWSGMESSRRLAARLACYAFFGRTLDARHQRRVRARTARLEVQLAAVREREGDLAGMRAALRSALRNAGWTAPHLLLRSPSRRLLRQLVRRLRPARASA
jgi:hypothetical protein